MLGVLTAQKVHDQRHRRPLASGRATDRDLARHVARAQSGVHAKLGGLMAALHN